MQAELNKSYFNGPEIDEVEDIRVHHSAKPASLFDGHTRIRCTSLLSLWFCLHYSSPTFVVHGTA